MYSVYQEAEKQNQPVEMKRTAANPWIEWLMGPQWHKFATASLSVVLVTVSVFFLGRWSLNVEPDVRVVDNNTGQ